MLPLVEMAVEGYTKSYLGSIKCVKLVWPKAEAPREVRKERPFVSFQRTMYELIRKGENQESLGHHGLDMAAQYARFICVSEGLVGRSILSYLSLWIRVIVVKMEFFDVNLARPPVVH